MRNPRAPRHLQLRELLLRRWRTAGMRVGDRIESQNEIVATFGYSLVTVLRTLRDMEDEHIIYRQVGRGSFLVRLPWAESYLRIGWFYNRDRIPGGIFSNVLYSHVIASLENTIVSDGHAFVLGSFTDRKMPVELWDRLDAVLLFGAPSDMAKEHLPETTSLIATMDMMLAQVHIDSHGIDMRPAFDGMLNHLGPGPQKVLYLDGRIDLRYPAIRDQELRSAAAARGHCIETLMVDMEHPDAAYSALRQAITRFKPDAVCGFLREVWTQELTQQYPDLPIYPVVTRPDARGFSVDARGWTRALADRTYARLADRTLPPLDTRFPVRFLR